MKLFYLFSLVLLISCAAPKASFIMDGNTEKIAPAEILFLNASKNATDFEWQLNGKTISQETNFDYRFLHSGLYEISLKASKGESVDTRKTKIFVKPPVNCRVLIQTDLGDMVFELNEDTDQHLHNFVSLVENGFYNGIVFHRVINGFMIQAGDPATKITGYNKEELNTIPQEISNELLHYKGVLAAARMPDNVNPDKASSGSQFYIVQGRTLKRQELEILSQEKEIPYREDQIDQYIERGGAPQLDGQYTVFGMMISGFDTLDRIAAVKTGQGDRPLEDVKIISMQIIK